MLRRGSLAAALLLLGAAAQAATLSFNGSAVGACSLSGSTYTCASLSLGSTDVVAIASGYTVVVNSSLDFSYNQGLTMSGSAQLQTSGYLDIGDINPANLAISGGTLTTGGNFKIGSQAQTIVANVNAASMTIGSGSTTKITGTLTASGAISLGSHVTIVGPISATTVATNSPVVITGDVSATSSFQLASGSTVKGNVSAPTVVMDPSSSSVTGNVSASSSLTIGSGNTINGTVTGGSMTMASSNVVINGNVTMSGDVDIGSSGTINGDLVARNVTTHASNDVINGNAAVNAIYLDWNSSVTKVITCTGPGAVLCSCVTKADPNYKPTCGAAAPSVPHHIQITHSGSAMTCQAQSVSLRACADAACSSSFTGSTTVTLTPGGGSVTFNGSASATVSQSTAGTATLNATGSGSSNATTCVNSSNGSSSCAMTFTDNGLQLSAPDHVSMTSANLTIQALKSGPNNGTCVPLVKNATVPVNFSCGYMNPASGDQPVTIGNTAVSCGSGSTAVPVTFDANGLGTPALQYPDVGLMSLNASYISGSLGASGGTNFTTAPAKFMIVATATTPVSVGTTADPAFARASDSFTLSVSAVNANGTVTKNFGNESTKESFILSQNLKLPSDGDNQITKGSFGTINSGVATSTAWTFAESGTITLNAALSNSSTYYLGKTGVTGFNTKGTLDLRFVPHHFNTALVAGIPMACAQLGGYSNPCAPSNTSGSFVYAKQGFFMSATAYRDASNVSRNYRPRTISSDSADVSRAVTLSAWTAANGTTADSTLAFTTTPTFAFSYGVGTLGDPAKSPVPVLPTLAFKGSGVGPSTIFLRAVDSDGATSQRSGATETPLTVVSGRMTIANVYGSSTSPVPIEARAQYYSSAAGTWLSNPLFTPVAPAQGAAIPLQASDGYYYDNATPPAYSCTGALTCTALQLVPGTLNFKNGTGLFSLAPPKASGSVMVRLQPSVISTYIPYLPINIGGRVTFGIYRSGPVLYLREVYN
jgi:MSHA biogenesis protein MshQ